MHVRKLILGLAQKISAATLLGTALCLSACHESPTVVKIGLVAPFEGRYRSIGYEVIPAVRLAIREFAQENAAKLSVELVAYDDGGEPDRASLQARKLVADPQVRAVIGHWMDDTTLAALGIYNKAGIAVITFTPMETSNYAHVVNMSPSIQALQAAAVTWGAQLNVDQPIFLESSGGIVEQAAQFDSLKEGGESLQLIGGPDWGLLQFDALTSSNLNGTYFVIGTAFPEDSSGDFWSTGRVESLSANYADEAVGNRLGIYSAAAYEATWLALELVMADTPVVNYLSILNVNLDNSGRRIDAPIYLYQWQDQERVLVDVLP